MWLHQSAGEKLSCCCRFVEIFGETSWFAAGCRAQDLIFIKPNITDEQIRDNQTETLSNMQPIKSITQSSIADSHSSLVSLLKIFGVWRDAATSFSSNLPPQQSVMSWFWEKILVVFFPVSHLCWGQSKCGMMCTCGAGRTRIKSVTSIQDWNWISLNPSLCCTIWVNLSNAFVQTCTSNAGVRNDAASRFGGSVPCMDTLPVCRSPGFRNDSLVTSLHVVMCNKYAATWVLCVCVCDVCDVRRARCHICNNVMCSQEAK